MCVIWRKLIRVFEVAAAAFDNAHKDGSSDDENTVERIEPVWKHIHSLNAPWRGVERKAEPLGFMGVIYVSKFVESPIEAIIIGMRFRPLKPAERRASIRLF